MPRLPEQSTFKPLEDTAFRIGKSLPPRQQTQPQSSGEGQFSNLKQVVKNQPLQQSQYSAPQSLKDLGPITVPFGGSTRYEPGGTHRGVDIAAPQGTPIQAQVGGVVKQVVRGKGWTPKTPSFGNYILIETPTGETIRYSHLYEDFVKVGEQIQRGQKIGSVGGTGSTYSQHHEGPGPHLDFSIKNAYNKYIDPLKYLANIK